jgi:hypothetical protein
MARTIRYADLAALLLDRDGAPVTGISTDRLHFNTQGYPAHAALDREIDGWPVGR